jgi:GNAT superfamily N-acetyltransferase
VITLAHVQPEDAEALAGLMDELERFYGGTPTEPLNEKVKQISEALFGERPAASALLAWDGDKLAGFASYSFLWPAAGFTKSLYLKELYVAQEHRRTGVGKRLMDALHEVARAEQCSRVEWTTDADNSDAQRFYDELGVPANASKIFYRSTL